MKQKGFTLIELMVVVAIIGVLATIIPAYKQFVARQKAKSSISSTISPPTFTSKETIVREYLPNKVRSHSEVELKQHADGTVYACHTDNSEKCYRVQ